MNQAHQQPCSWWCCIEIIEKSTKFNHQFAIVSWAPNSSTIFYEIQDNNCWWNELLSQHKTTVGCFLCGITWPQQVRLLCCLIQPWGCEQCQDEMDECPRIVKRLLSISVSVSKISFALLFCLWNGWNAFLAFDVNIVGYHYFPRHPQQLPYY